MSPTCPGKPCGLPTGVRLDPDEPGDRMLVCAACGLVWQATPEEYAQADAADRAHEERREREEREAREREQAAKDRAQARAMFEAAGRPVPAWLREGA